jgi:predicted glycosyltransferase
MKRRDHVRILMYSHDTFGLGHLRRCRTIAHYLAERFGGMHIMIISGSPIAGAFDFKTRVDFIKIPASSSCATASTPRSPSTWTSMTPWRCAAR